MRIKIVVLFIGWLVAVTQVSAQQSDYKFSHHTNTPGLSNNQINTILKDRKGFMWFGTISGLSRYDGFTIKTFRHDIRDSASISGNNISEIFEGPDDLLWITTNTGETNIYNPLTESFFKSASKIAQGYGLPILGVTRIIKDQSGSFWFLYPQQGLYVLKKGDQKAVRLTIGGEGAPILQDRISDMNTDHAGNLWLLHRSGLLERYAIAPGKIIFRSNILSPYLGGNPQNYNLFVDADGDPWCYLNGETKGIVYFNAKAGTSFYFHKDAPKLKLNTSLIRAVAQDRDGLIWVGTDHGGVNLINKKNLNVQYLLHHPDDSRSIGQNSIYSLYQDNSGIMWVGTFKAGVSYYHREIIKFPVIQNQASNPNSLPFSDINRFAEDAKGNLWIGTNGGGLIYYNRTNNSFKQYLHQPGNPNSLSNNVIVGMQLDKKGILWIGTYFGGLNAFDGKKFTHYRHNAANSGSLADDRVWEIYEDSQQNLWVGTLGGGLDLLNRETGVFKHYKSDQPHSIHSDYISYIHEDRKQNLWIATVYGFDKLDRKTGRFIHYVNRNNNPKGLSNNTINNIIEDVRGLIWVGTAEGLNLFNPKDNSIQVFGRETGLPDNSILGITEDNQHNIWVSTHKGLTNVIVSGDNKESNYKFTVKNYDASDGLQAAGFNSNAFYKTRRGELIFGGPNGFNIFNPEKLKVNKNLPQVILSELQVFNQSIRVGEKLNKRIVLEKALDQTSEITLKHYENMFSVSFAALSYFQPEKNQFMYLLEGFNNNWLPSDSRIRKATFTNLDPGTYYFKVKVANNDGVWNKEEKTLKITVLPPFWKTWWAFVVYALLVAFLLWLARRIILERERLKFRIDQERQEAKRRHELDMMKIKFFTNVSHEFRTPLTLILAPLEKLLQNINDQTQNNQLQLMQRNAKRLLNLVNQLLDFRKMEVQEIALHPTRADIIKFIQEIALSFLL